MIAPSPATMSLTYSSFMTTLFIHSPFASFLLLHLIVSISRTFHLQFLLPWSTSPRGVCMVYSLTFLGPLLKHPLLSEAICDSHTYNDRTILTSLSLLSFLFYFLPYVLGENTTYFNNVSYVSSAPTPVTRI